MNFQIEALIYLGGLIALILVAWAGWAMNRRRPGTRGAIGPAQQRFVKIRSNVGTSVIQTSVMSESCLTPVQVPGYRVKCAPSNAGHMSDADHSRSGKVTLLFCTDGRC